MTQPSHHSQLTPDNDILTKVAAYLPKSPFALGHLVDHPYGDEGEGDGGQEPADDVGPHRVGVRVAELEWGMFDYGEYEGALCRASENGDIIVHMDQLYSSSKHGNLD